MPIKRPLRSKRQQRVSRKITLPSPLGGWNARDNLDLMQPTDAVVMDNWIARESYLELRNGYTKKVTIPNIVETLFAYEVAGNKKLLAASNGEILELDLGADSTTSLASGYNSDQWQYTIYKNRIFACNGNDLPFVYNGSTVGATGFTGSGLTLSNLVNVVQFKNRLFFIEKGTLKFWHTDAAGNITGTLLEFDLSQFSKLGGELIAIDTWGQNDSQLVLITSEGEVFVYSGTDPADATNWYLRGIYTIPKPLGYRSTQQFAGDLIVITQDGYYPLSKVLPLEESNKAVAFSDKISGAVQDLRNRWTSFGWQIRLYSKGSYLLVNVPYKSGEYRQHIMNTVTGAWSQFVGQNSACFEVFDDNIYFGGRNGNVYQADSGTTDDGALIDGYVQQAYSNYGSNEIKHFKEISTIISTELDLIQNIFFGVDFKDAKKSFSSSPTAGGGLWNTFLWNTTFWSAGGSPTTRRIPLVADIGYKGSIGIKTQSSQGEIKWFSSVVIFEIGTGVK
jgi:hypothetical protein